VPQRIFACLVIGFGAMLLLVSVAQDMTGGGFGWEPVLEFTSGGLVILLGLYLFHPKRT